jgi:hypothetical protein
MSCLVVDVEAFGVRLLTGFRSGWRIVTQYPIGPETLVLPPIVRPVPAVVPRPSQRPALDELQETAIRWFGEPESAG